MPALRPRRARAAGAVAGAAALVVLSVLTAQAEPFGARETGPGAAPYLVTFKAGTSSGEQQEIREEATDDGGEISRTYSRAVRGFAAELPPRAVEELRADPEVAAVTADGVVRALGGGVQNPAPWNLDRIDQRSPAGDSSFRYDGDGKGIHVYVVDSGIRPDHTEFLGRLGSGFTAINDGRGTGDCSGHGSHVAGIAGGSTYGVAKGVTLVPVRVLNCNGAGSISGVLAGLDWVLSHHVPGRSVINLSLGGPADSTLDAAVNSAVAAGIPVVAAAGNESANACAFSPARVPQAVTVGAVDRTDARASFSNFGSCLDLFAPGVGIVGPTATSPTAVVSASGTSQAAPHVAGALAVLLQGAPGATPAALRSALAAAATAGALTNLGANSPDALLYAPPKLRLAGVGSATTAPLLSALGADPAALALEGQAVVEAFATSGSSPIASQEPATVPGCSMTRPHSQAAARAGLLSSLAAGNGCVQFAQAESLDLSVANPRLVYVPFARENVTYAITNTSNLVPNRTLAWLRSAYRCQAAATVRPMLPEPGSGLREFWIGQMYEGPRPAALPCLQDGVDEHGLAIPPNAGGQLNDFELVPMSVAQWTGQAAGVLAEQRGRTRLAQIDAHNPFGPIFGMQRDLYVVFAESALAGTAVTDLRLRSSFVGGGSLLCAAVAGPIGVRYGFQQHPGCGSTAHRTS